jgi:hypothetical protein
MDQFSFWVPGTSVPTGQVGWADNLSVATFSAALGYSTVDGTRAAQIGDPFYLRIEYYHTSRFAITAMNVSPLLTLPSGMVRADSQLPVRCAAVLPPKTQMTEYVGGCSLASTSSSQFRILSNSGVSPAPAFLMTPGTRWLWYVPVVASSPQPMTTTQVTMTTVAPGVWATESSISLPTFAGDPGSPIWQHYKSAGSIIYGGKLISTLGLPDTAEVPVPWGWRQVPSTPVGSMENFKLFGNQPVTVTSSPRYGTFRIEGTLRAVWLRYASTLGPATTAAHWVDRRILRQDFAGGWVYYDDLFESTYLGGTYYCYWDPNSMNC